MLGAGSAAAEAAGAAGAAAALGATTTAGVLLAAGAVWATEELTAAAAARPALPVATAAAGSALLFATTGVETGTDVSASGVRPLRTDEDAAAETESLAALPRAEFPARRGASVLVDVDADESLPAFCAELDAPVEPLPVSAKATAVPPIMTAPIPSVTAPTPSHA